MRWGAGGGRAEEREREMGYRELEIKNREGCCGDRRAVERDEWDMMVEMGEEEGGRRNIYTAFPPNLHPSPPSGPTEKVHGKRCLGQI